MRTLSSENTSKRKVYIMLVSFGPILTVSYQEVGWRCNPFQVQTGSAKESQIGLFYFP